MQYIKSVKIESGKHNLIISFSVGSDHNDKYSYEISHEISHEYLSGWRNVSTNITQM